MFARARGRKLYVSLLRVLTNWGFFLSDSRSPAPGPGPSTWMQKWSAPLLKHQGPPTMTPTIGAALGPRPPVRKAPMTDQQDNHRAQQQHGHKSLRLNNAQETLKGKGGKCVDVARSEESD